MSTLTDHLQLPCPQKAAAVIGLLQNPADLKKFSLLAIPAFWARGFDPLISPRLVWPIANIWLVVILAQ
jgi:hypothetical protein